jgi:hypothetical protein
VLGRRFRELGSVLRMSAARVPLFCDTALAERIEGVEAQLIAKASEAAGRRRADTVRFVIPIAGGVATFAEQGSPFNKVAGLGFGGIPSTAALDHIEWAFTASGAPVQVELARGGEGSSVLARWEERPPDRPDVWLLRLAE